MKYTYITKTYLSPGNCVTYELILAWLFKIFDALYGNRIRFLRSVLHVAIQVNPVHILKTYMYHAFNIHFNFNSNPRLGLTGSLFSNERFLALWVQKEYTGCFTTLEHNCRR